MAASGGQAAMLTLLFFLLFGMTATCSFESVVHSMKNKLALATGLCLQFLVLPFLGFVSVKIFSDHIPPAVGVTLLVATSSPSGTLSNLWCSLFNAELSLSVALTTLSSILGIVMLPLNLLLYSYAAFGANSSIIQKLNWKGLFTSLGIVFGAITGGLIATRTFRNRTFHVFINRLGSVCGIALVATSFTLSSRTPGGEIWNRSWGFYVAVALPVVVAVIISNFVGLFTKLPGPERTAVVVECSFQNIGVAMSVGFAAFRDPALRGQALGVPMYYGIVQVIVTTLYCLMAWKLGWTKAPQNEKIHVMIGKSYELGDDDESEETNNGESTKGDQTEIESEEDGKNSNKLSIAGESFDTAQDNDETEKAPSAGKTNDIETDSGSVHC